MSDDRPMEDTVLPEEEALGGDLKAVPFIVAVDVGTLPVMNPETGEGGVFGGMRIRWSMLDGYNDRSTDSKTNMVFAHPSVVMALIQDLTEILPKLQDPTATAQTDESTEDEAE